MPFANGILFNARFRDKSSKICGAGSKASIFEAGYFCFMYRVKRPMFAPASIINGPEDSDAEGGRRLGMS